MIACAPILILLSVAGSDALGEVHLPDGWAWADEAQVYDRDTLYEYLNGGAMFYLSYSLELLTVRECVGPEAQTLVVELYTFGPGGDSHGVFLQETRGERPERAWDDAVYGAGLLKIREGRYVARLQSRRRNDSLRDTQLRIATGLAERLNDDDQAPELLTRLRAALPAELRVPNSERYFHAQESLNGYYYLAQENVLGLSVDTECVMVAIEPQADGSRATLLVVEYRNPPMADEARTGLLGLWGPLPEPPEQPLARRDGDILWGATVAGNRLGVVLEADTPRAADAALAVIARLAEPLIN